MQEEEDPLFHELVTIAYIDYVDTLVAFVLQGTRPGSQEENLGSSWELPEKIRKAE